MLPFERRHPFSTWILASCLSLVVPVLSGCSDDMGASDQVDVEAPGRGGDTTPPRRPPGDGGDQPLPPDTGTQPGDEDPGGLDDDELGGPGEPCVDDTDCIEDGAVCVDATCAAACTSDLECTGGRLCIDGACVLLSCETDDICDNANPCTDDVCRDGICVRTYRMGEVDDLIPGDCTGYICVDGAPAPVADDTDLPADDGINCTRAVCQDGRPQHVPDHDLCLAENPDDPFSTCSISDGGCVTRTPSWICETEYTDGWIDEELCDDGLDNNANGLVDEGCDCEFGTTQRCYLGPPNTRGVGACLDGIQQCIDRVSPRWGECTGGILPSEEICDGKDNACNGCVDDVENCDSLLSCPVEDFARPLTDYVLDGEAILGSAGTDWEWRVVAPPNSGTRNVENPRSARTRVHFDVSGDYEISVTVTDEKGVRMTCAWVVRVQGVGLRVEMRWDTFGSVDMDLHLHRPGSTRGFCTSDDCYYANCVPGFFGGGGISWYPNSTAPLCPPGRTSCRNPRLDLDNISGFTPENINVDNPNDGDTFRVMAHMFSGSRVTNPVISVYCGGVLRGVFGEAPDQVGMSRSSGACRGETWRVADVTMHVDPATGATDCTIQVLLNPDGDDWDVRFNDTSY